MLEFEEGKHEYKFDGVVIPSVTQVLSPLYEFEGIPDYILENARNRGIAVHKATELYDLDRLDWSSVHPTIEPYLDAWIRFKNENAFTTELIEQKVFNEKHRFAGTLDRTGILFGERVLLDIKAVAKVSKVTALQTAAYESCLEHRCRRFCVQLRKDGKYDLVEYKDRMDFHKFITILNYHRIKGEFA